jgi:hypothetical protein
MDPVDLDMFSGLFLLPAIYHHLNQDCLTPFAFSVSCTGFYFPLFFFLSYCCVAPLSFLRRPAYSAVFS